jgi:uncharacterized membrane protein
MPSGVSETGGVMPGSELVSIVRTVIEWAYESYKQEMGRSLLLGLEFLVAGDVVRTVALEPTLTNVAVLGLLVLIRMFLSWSLAVEIEGRWPWQTRTEKHIPVETTMKPDSREGLQ